jgi:alcohol dehydrogenase class IV
VIADPELTTGLPQAVTAATGMDALSHSLEAYCSTSYHPMADGIALEAIRLIKDWLPIACTQPENLEARSHMLVASSMGATAFQKGLGAMHALAHPLGAIYDAHHGLLNAILMPYVLQRNRSAIEAKMQTLSRCLGLTVSGVGGVISFILALRKEIGIPNDLASIGINAERASEISNMAKRDPSDSGNPVELSVEDYQQLFQHAVAGQL